MSTPELVALAAEVEAAGKADAHTIAASQALLKGVSDGLNGLIGLLNKVVPMAKGKGNEPDPEADPAPAAGGGGQNPDDGPPGYEDMMFGRSGLSNGAPPVETDPNGNINVTKFLWATGQAIQNLEKGRKADALVSAQLLKLAKSQQTRIEQLEELVRGGIEGQIRIASPMAKAVADLTVAVHEIPAPTGTAGGATKFRQALPRPTQNDSALLGGSPDKETQLLAKGLSRGILDASMRRRFHLSRTFHEDQAENAKIRSKLEALA